MTKNMEIPVWRRYTLTIIALSVLAALAALPIVS